MRWAKLMCACGIAAATLAAAACGGGGDTDGESTPQAVRTAVAQANTIVLQREDAGDGWEALPDDSGTPDVAGADAILNRAFKSWAGCVGNILSGGFVGLGRAGTASSPRFADGSGRLVAGAAAIFVEEDRADQVVAQLDQSGEECDVVGQDFSVELGTPPAAPADAAVAYRMTATLQARNGTFSDTFDLVVFQKDTVVSTLLFKGFGADESGQSEILTRAVARLP